MNGIGQEVFAVLRSVVVTITAVFVVGLGGFHASAQGKKNPVDVFNEASDLAAKGEVDKAIRMWLDVANELPLKHRPRVHFALGLSFAALKKYPEAWHHLAVHIALAEAPQSEALALFKESQAELEKGHTKVRITCDPQSLRVHLGAGPVGVSYDCPLTWWYVPGAYTVKARGPGGLAAEKKFTVKKGAPTAVVAVKAVVPVRPVRPVDPPIFVGEEEEKKTNWWGWGLVAGGLVSMAGGGVFHYLAYAKNEQLYDDYKADDLYDEKFDDKYGPAYDDEVWPKLFASYVLYGMGGAAVAAGVVMLVVEGEKPRPGAALFSPVLTPEGAGFSCGWSF